MTDIVTVCKLSKFYMQGSVRLPVLTNVNLSLKKDVISVLLGSSGSGKSTFLNMVGLLDVPSSGDIFFAGVNVCKLSMKQRTLIRGKNIGFIFQAYHLLQDLTALENVMLPMLLHKVKRQSAKDKAQVILKKLEIAERSSYYPSSLSGGEQQRVAIARAIVCQPRLIIADEPTGNLDRQKSQEVFDLLQHIVTEYKLSVLVATHDLSFAKQVSEKFVIDDAHIVKLTKI